MSPAVQAKLLRVLQEREFQRLGGTRTLKADVRVIAATNRDLQAAMTRGAFREDLYYRLHVFAIHLPPLRERQEDILPLLEHFVEELGPVVIGRPAAGISREARAPLLADAWPGTVRELRNAVERALILCEGGLINPEHLPWHAESATSAPLPAVPAAPQAAVGDVPAHGVDLEAMERTLIEGALKQTGRNKSKAAKLLGLSRASSTRAWSALGSRSSGHHLDRRHHPLVLVRQQVAVVHEPADDVRIGERDDHLHFAVHRHVDDVLIAVEVLADTVYLGDLKRRLVDVEVVQLAGLVPDGPLFDRAQLDARVDAVRVEGAAVHEERVAVGRFGEHDRAAIRDPAA